MIEAPSVPESGLITLLRRSVSTVRETAVGIEVVVPRVESLIAVPVVTVIIVVISHW